MKTPSTNGRKQAAARQTAAKQAATKQAAAKHAAARELADRIGQIAAINKSHAVVEFALDGTILTANENFLQALGYTLEEVQGRHHSMFVDEAYRQSAEYKDLWARLARGEYQTGEYKRIGKGGRTVWIQGSYIPILDANGRPFKVVKYATNVTRQVKLRQNLQALMERTARSATALAGAAQELTAVSQQMASNAEETAAQANVASAAAEQVSKNVNTVSTGTEEMGASIKEIAKNANEAARVATAAVKVADTHQRHRRQARRVERRDRQCHQGHHRRSPSKPTCSP